MNFGAQFAVLLLAMLRFVSDVCALTLTDRVDCIPERRKVKTESICKRRGCVWQADDTVLKGAPRCYFDSSHGYNANGDLTETKLGQHLRLTKIGSKTLFGKDIQEIDFDVEYQTRTRLRFTFSDTKKKRYRVPMDLPKISKTPSETDYSKVKVIKKPFSFKISRTENSDSSIWDSSLGPLIFSDQYLQISTRLPSKYIYGFGEQEHESFLHELKWQRLGMFTRDQFPFNKGSLYGVHPFYMCLEESGKAHGVFLMNSNAMDVQLQPSPGLTFRTIGGILDFYIFMGPTPEDVVQQYTELIGRTFMPPYWSLGFQLSRWGYNSLKRVKEVVDKMAEYDLPQDVQYGDIDYMERKLDFTYDRITYDGLPDFVKSLQDDGMHYIIILDPVISVNETDKYPPYEKGNAKDVWIKNSDNNTLLGKLWPAYPFVTEHNTSLPWDTQIERYSAFGAYPDFFKSSTQEWWIEEIKEFHKTIPFDGIWIDMNEPSNFVRGSVDGCKNNSYNIPPYLPWLDKDEIKDLLRKTICMDAIQALGGGTIHYNVHSLYGWSQSKPTQRAAREATGKRSIVISRSTFAGDGKKTGHWLGDNKSSWNQMHKSIIGMLEFNLFGIPYIGADICGFFDDATPELCARWMQLGAFYPFSRNHNALGRQPQDPGSFGKEFADLVRPIMKTRYSLLPYLYTLFYQSHTTGATVVRSLMHEFTNDKKTWAIDKQFLWGPALLVTAVLEKTKTSVRGYIPEGRWYDFKTGKEHDSSSRWSEFDAPHNSIVLHVRGGYILPLQETANNTVFGRRKPMELLVGLNDDQKATGQLFWDDGESIDTIERKKYYIIEFEVDKNILVTKVTHHGHGCMDCAPPNLKVISIFGIKGFVTRLTVNGEEPGVFSFSSKDQTLHIREINLNLAQNSTIRWSLKKSRASGLSSVHVVIFVLLFAFAIQI
ncbi:sucrase-isomaltase, intestinal-like [Dendronephthya gigantea]|uniref:sucrase-isomaltase, intestinal-like n=1 Tax=Dendronephthya gigantea TaxID=151771 RepID=UPI00106C5CA6|nr:sucrase-isomaltase, intestinal-like [Dendronephthya gigantea]